ncbi:competence type IV pilus minor pilin ComGF [Geomicrobium sp. JCM 19039]|uniref:competence type IV pilus minor pilin ComGF n=1 Tax=Geomicrobium sp. JCM 19039 TaxID=1460636 RepID=UPI00045F4114|nr:competence type IV pilus minor pilin ComGF [Geomicrobium sp. JCM 19039]GAK12767.1 hypothetical protein JCM19039_2566 [Geomicrobium sp. JCM 19039]
MHAKALDDRGFTLLETMVAMMILFSVLAVIPLAMKAVQPLGMERLHHQHEMFVWFQQLQREAMHTKEYIVHNRHLLTMVDTDGTERMIRMRNGNLVQQVDGRGHTILLTNIDRFLVETSNDGGVRVTITNHNREHKQVLDRSTVLEGEFISVKRVQ